MEQVTDFFKGLFDTKLWPPRWRCGQWSDFHGWLYIISDLAIWLSYFLIPIIILDYFTRRKDKLKFQKVYFLFAAFILLCGATHFLDALMFWVPVYRFNAVIRFLTAVVSLATVFHLIKILPEAFKQKTSAELEREIALRMQVEAKLAEANDGLKAFAYIASHDLQEPLRKIKMYTSLLNEMNEHKYDDKSKEYAAKITEASQRMRQLIEDVLRLSSMDSDFAMGKVSLSTVMQQVTETLEVKIAERSAQINVAGHLPMVYGNETYLVQLFTNLVGNSLKFSKEAPVVGISAQQREGKVVIEVTDNGIGMDSHNISRIFEAFRRLNPKGDYEGSGIGLAICKKIVDLHQGKIDVKSEPGNGTSFFIELTAV